MSLFAERPKLPLQPLGADFTEADTQEIARIAVERGWQVAAHEHMKVLNHRAYRLAIDEYSAQLRFLLPLTPESRVLQLQCGWGAVALNMATCTASVVAMDDRAARLCFLSARRAHMGAENLHIVYGSPSPPLPFVDGTFDAVIILDVLAQVGATAGSKWKRMQHEHLEEAKRVLRSGGWLLLGVANRLGFFRPHMRSPRHLRTYWGYCRVVHDVGFSKTQFHSPLPSHQEPFFILPLDRSRLLTHFIDRMFTAEDYRSKLEARGLGSAYRLAQALWRVGRRLQVTALLRYVVPDYLILARK
jgi:SAM-dependent methyltransferase